MCSHIPSKDYLLCISRMFSHSKFFVSSLLIMQLSKSAKDAASKVQEQGEELGKTEAFKTFSTVWSVLYFSYASTMYHTLFIVSCRPFLQTDQY